MNILATCGQYSYNKHLPANIWDWTPLSAQALLKGYIETDGFTSFAINVTTVSSVSKRLILEVIMMMRYFEKTPCWTHSPSYKRSDNIQGRPIKSRDLHILRLSLQKITRHFSEFDYGNDCIWASVRTPQYPDEPYKVYNISVDEDPSYYADGVLVHNCSVRCSGQCSHCSLSCSFHCDTSCHKACSMNCQDLCKDSCSSNCSTLIVSDTSLGKVKPTNPTYHTPNPSNTKEEIEALKVIKE